MVVVHHFKEDLGWLSSLHDVAPVTVVSRTLHELPESLHHAKGITLIHEPDSNGQEVNGYLRYIIEHYESLPDQLAFIHAHRSSWHTANQDELLRVANWEDEGYRPINKRDQWTVTKPIPYFSHGLAELPGVWDELFREELGEPRLETARYYCCGSFMVTKEAIRIRSLATYKRWHAWVQNASLHNEAKFAGYWFEYSWHRIFGRSWHNSDIPDPVLFPYHAPLYVNTGEVEGTGRRHIVIHHYSEDLGWVVNLPSSLDDGGFSVTIVSRSKMSMPEFDGINGINLIYEVNSAGHEVNGYLRYILDHYDNLPDQIAFIHGHHTSWHTGPQDEVLKHAEWDGEGYRSLQRDRRWRLDGSTGNENPNSATLILMRTYWNELFGAVLGPMKQEEISYYCCGSFIVSREAILKHPKHVYTHWHQWVATKDYNNKAGYFFEYTWHRIFGCEVGSPNQYERISQPPLPVTSIAPPQRVESVYKVSPKPLPFNRPHCFTVGRRLSSLL